MTIASNLQRIINAKAAIKAAIIEKGVEVPDDEKVDNYAGYIDKIGGGGGYDPENPTLYGLKAALDAGDYTAFPVGTTIPDTYNGTAIEWIVCQYGTATVEGGASRNGVYLCANSVLEQNRIFNNNNSNLSYEGSVLKTFIDSTMFDRCSTDLQNTISTIQLPSGGISKLFPMSRTEMYGVGEADEGVYWEYWKNATGLSEPSNNANTGRAKGSYIWLRTGTYDKQYQHGCMYPNGQITYAAISNEFGVLPACFIAKGTSGGEEPQPDISAPDLSQPLDAAQLENLQNIVSAGKASEYLNLGDELLVSYGSYTMPFEVVGFEDVEVEGGETKPAINLLAKYTSETDSKWGINNNVTLYSVSTLRTSVTTLNGKLDSDFVACLASTKIQTYNRDGSTDTVYDKLFAPSMAQLGVTDSNYYREIEGPAFNAYQGVANAKRIKNGIDATTTAQQYWTRSFYSGSVRNFGYVLTSGAPDYNNPTYTCRIVAACNFIGK